MTEDTQVKEEIQAANGVSVEEELPVQEIVYKVRVYADTKEDAVSFIDSLLEEAAEVDSYEEVE